MNAEDTSAQRIRLAVLTPSISHFEVPLFRLCAQMGEVDIKVFYSLPVKRQTYDSEYNQSIDWGADLLNGYDSQRIGDSRGLDRAAWDWGADIVLLYGYSWPGAPATILRNWWLGRPQIHRGTLNYYPDPRRPVRGRILRPFGRLLLRLFDAHHYGGDYSRKVLLDAGADPDALFFVPYSVDTPFFAAAAEDKQCIQAAARLRAALGWTVDDRVVLFIAQHNWFKGPDIAIASFIEVARADPRARFLVVGSGRMTDAMKATAARELDPACIHYAGFVPSLDTVPYYLASDLVLCSSRYETWARMVNEAMLCRRPCLASRIVPAVGGLIEQGVNGLVVERPDAGLFAQAIQDYFALAPSARRAMGEAARDRALQFAYEPNVGNAIAAAHHALARHQRRRGDSA